MAIDHASRGTALAGRRVLVVGLGRSGVAAARLCLAHGAQVTVTDSRDAAALSDALAPLAGQVTLELGGHRARSFTSTQLLVLSPGVPPLPELEAARRAGVPTVGEIELAAGMIAAPIVAITGTNGKSTTTSLCGAMLQASGVATFCGGNLGRPLAEAVVEGDPALGVSSGRVVLELSSFQLESVQHFSAHVAVLLNLSQDHLDRYARYDDYLAAKARVFERQTAADFAVVNGRDDQRDCLRLARSSAARLLTFGGPVPAQAASRLPGPGAWLDGDDLVLRLPGDAPERYARESLSLAGQHNAHNALAALLAARLAGASRDGCARALAAFEGLPHRMGLVVERNGVRYYDDSKATNVGSVVGSLSGFERPVILIAGGKDKGGDYAPLLAVVAEVCRHVVLIGAAADRITETLRAGPVPLHRATSLPEAVARATELARVGDAVVLSPACSSYDMFDSFEHRGRVFADAVRSLPG